MKSAKRRQRLRGITKWGGLTLCALLFALWLASGRFVYTIGRVPRSVVGWDQPIIQVSAGTISLTVPSASKREELSSWYTEFLGPEEILPYWEWKAHVSLTQDWFYSVVPLWLPLLLIALPTGILFWSDHRRRMRSDCCIKCGYNLTGNTSGTCPECGAEIGGPA